MHQFYKILVSDSSASVVVLVYYIKSYFVRYDKIWGLAELKL